MRRRKLHFRPLYLLWRMEGGAESPKLLIIAWSFWWPIVTSLDQNTAVTQETPRGLGALGQEPRVKDQILEQQQNAPNALNHLGNHKSLGSSVPGTGDRDQYVYFFHYLIPVFFLALRMLIVSSLCSRVCSFTVLSLATYRKNSCYNNVV